MFFLYPHVYPLLISPVNQTASPSRRALPPSSSSLVTPPPRSGRCLPPTLPPPSQRRVPPTSSAPTRGSWGRQLGTLNPNARRRYAPPRDPRDAAPPRRTALGVSDRGPRPQCAALLRPDARPSRRRPAVKHDPWGANSGRCCGRHSHAGPRLATGTAEQGQRARRHGAGVLAAHGDDAGALAARGKGATATVAP
jgi:hypothetical protein